MLVNRRLFGKKWEKMSGQKEWKIRLTDVPQKRKNTQYELGDNTDLHGKLITLRPDCSRCPVMRTFGQHRLNDISGRIYTKQGNTQEGKKALFYFRRTCYIYFLPAIRATRYCWTQSQSVKAASKSMWCTSTEKTLNILAVLKACLVDRVCPSAFCPSLLKKKTDRGSGKGSK